MRLILTLVAFLFLQPISNAQCKALNINDLQVIQKADPAEKDAKIKGFGFDLRNSITKEGQTWQVYTRCWNTMANKQAIFEQKICWNVSTDAIKFMTFNEAHFQALRKELDERHPSGIGAVVVVGKMFKYYFGAERSDGVEYHSLTLTFK